MAGTAKNYDVTRMQQGPGDLWIIGGGVADSATPQLTLFTDGTPDATAHPASIHLGATSGAIALAFAGKPEDIMADQFEGAIARYNVGLKMTIEAELQQLDPTIIQSNVPYATYATAGGYKQITFGGVSAMGAGVCVAVIAPKRSNTAKYLVAILFAAHGMVGISTSFGRAKVSNYKAMFEAMQDPSRTVGRQTGVFYETI